MTHEEAVALLEAADRGEVPCQWRWWDGPYPYPETLVVGRLEVRPFWDPSWEAGEWDYVDEWRVDGGEWMDVDLGRSEAEDRLFNWEPLDKAAEPIPPGRAVERDGRWCVEVCDE